MATTNQRLYPSLDDISGKRKHTSVSDKENRPAVPAKRAKLYGTPIRTPRPNPATNALQSRIELEYKIRDGAAKLLQASKSTRQSIEASKGLFVSNAKIIALMKELQERKENTDKGISDQLSPCKAKIAISDIRIPLEWKEFDNIKAKADTRYGVFCLLKMGNQVMDSSTLANVDRTTMDIVFRDTIIFPEMVGPDFNLEIEVYCSVPVEETSSKPSTPSRMFKKLRSKAHDKIEGSPAPQSTVPSSPYTPHAVSVTPTHRFVIAGHARLTIKDVSNSCRTYLLKRGSVGASGTAAAGSEWTLLPLWGQICCTLMAEPACAKGVRKEGFINLQRMMGGLPDWSRLWCVVRQHHLRFWVSPEDVGKRDLSYQLELTKSMVVEPAPRLSIRRPNALLLKDNSNEFFIAFESKDVRTEWMSTLKQAILDMNMWNSSCEFVIPVPQSKFYTESPSMETLKCQSDVITTVTNTAVPGSKSETTL